ncbi:MAG: 6-hydroxymethylpterin diphosphokinase MptE-like protein [Promethearchaeota archaeon]
MVNSLKKQISFFDEFKEWYYKILTDFKFNIQEDRNARDFLSHILLQSSVIWNLEDILKSFKNMIQSKPYILVYGCGPSLEITMEKVEENLFFGKSVNLAADGASVFLKEKQIPVDGIFTDLDGITINEFYYPEFIIVHAHGDNIKNLKFFKETYKRYS